MSEIGYHSMKDMSSSQGIDKANPVVGMKLPSGSI